MKEIRIKKQRFTKEKRSFLNYKQSSIEEVESNFKSKINIAKKDVKEAHQ
jgi:hypothetical protein